MEINKSIINAMLEFVGKDNVRWFLNKLYVDYDNKRIVATNGHTMAVLEGVYGLEGKGSQLIEPASLKAAMASLPRGKAIRIDRSEIDPAKVTISGVTFNEPDDGEHYPRHEPIFEQKNTGKGQFPLIRAKYMAAAEKLMNCFDPKQFTFTPGKLSRHPLFIESNNGDVRIVIMPVKAATAYGTYGKKEINIWKGDPDMEGEEE